MSGARRAIETIEKSDSKVRCSTRGNEIVTYPVNALRRSPLDFFVLRATSCHFFEKSCRPVTASPRCCCVILRPAAMRRIASHAFHSQRDTRLRPRTPPHTEAAPELGRMAAPPRTRDSRTPVV